MQPATSPDPPGASIIVCRRRAAPPTVKILLRLKGRRDGRDREEGDGGGGGGRGLPPLVRGKTKMMTRATQSPFPPPARE
jgi:hypothetical protein